MGRKCIVPNCTSGYNKNNEKVSLFAIPKDSLKKYSQAILRNDRILTVKDHVCAKHFETECIIRELKTDCYTIPLKVPQLRNGSLPTIFPNCPESISKKLPQKRCLIVKHDGTQVKRERPNTKVETVQQSDPVEIASDNKIDIFQTPFDILWGNLEILTLPSSLWCVHLIPNNDNNLITLTKMVPLKNNVLLEKKIVLNKNFEVDCYIFEHLIANSESDLKICNIEQLKNFLITFDNVSACYGSTVKVLDNYKSTVYYKDVYCQRWRHSKCDFVLHNVNNNNSSQDQKCNFCQKMFSALRFFKNNKRNATLKKLIHRRLRQKKQKQELRLKNKLEIMSKNLQNLQEKINEMELLR